MKTKILILIISLFYSSVVMVRSQDFILPTENPTKSILTTVPFMAIAPDSRSGSMGDAGVASSADVNSQHWNPAKYVFMEERTGFAISYTPWLKNIGITDLNLAYLAGYYKFDERQSVSMGLRYFNLGEIQYTNSEGGNTNKGYPQEWALDVGYSRLFSDYLSAGIVFRYIRSDIANGASGLSNLEYDPGQSVAADLALFYEKPIQVNGLDAQYALGLNISNIGSKMAYSDGDEKAFIPTNLRLGGRFSVDLDDYNSLAVLLDLNKLLVPSPPVRDDSTGQVIAGKDDDVNTFPGMIQSFYDAPDGFSEEMQEIMFSVGLEYWYREQFAIRAGYFNEHENKGSRKYVTAGLGLRLNVFSLDFSYLIPTKDGRNSPLANTMRFTLGFLFE